MPKVPKGKAHLQAYVDEKVVEELRKLVFMKYGNFRSLSYEVEQALRAWLAAHRARRRRAGSASSTTSLTCEPPSKNRQGVGSGQGVLEGEVRLRARGKWGSDPEEALG